MPKSTSWFLRPVRFARNFLRRPRNLAIRKSVAVGPELGTIEGLNVVMFGLLTWGRMSRVNPSLKNGRARTSPESISKRGYRNQVKDHDYPITSHRELIHFLPGALTLIKREIASREGKKIDSLKVCCRNECAFTLLNGRVAKAQVSFNHR